MLHFWIACLHWVDISGKYWRTDFPWEEVILNNLMNFSSKICAACVSFVHVYLSQWRNLLYMNCSTYFLLIKITVLNVDVQVQNIYRLSPLSVLSLLALMTVMCRSNALWCRVSASGGREEWLEGVLSVQLQTLTPRPLTERGHFENLQRPYIMGAVLQTWVDHPSADGCWAT